MPPNRSARSTGHRRGAVFLAGLGVLVLAVSGCSSPDPAGAADQSPADPAGAADQSPPDQQDVLGSVIEQLQSQGIDIDGDVDAGDDPTDEASGDGGAEQQQEAPPIKLWLPAEPSADNAGWQRSPIHCENRSEGIGSSYVGFAVPGEWELGRRSGGSGTPRGMGFDYGYESAEAGRVMIGINSDTRDTNGALTKDGQPVSDPTFDYDYSVGDDTVRITFESLGEIPVGESTAELFVATPDQAPDRLKDVVYKARVDQFDMPVPMFDGSWTLQPNTFVIELSYSPENGEVAEDTVRSIISSLVMPDCSLAFAVAVAEMNSQRDIDGDGHISDQQDYMEALRMGG